MKPISILVLVLIVFVWAQQSKPQTSNSKVPTDFIVVDSTGKTVGPVVGVGELHSVIVAFSFGGSLLPIEVFRTSFFHGLYSLYLPTVPGSLFRMRVRVHSRHRRYRDPATPYTLQADRVRALRLRPPCSVAAIASP